jgi:hypothetical protein
VVVAVHQRSGRRRPSAQWSSPSNIGQMAGRGINAALEILSWLATTL